MFKAKRLIWTLVFIIFGVGVTSAFISNEKSNPRMIRQLAPALPANLIQPIDHIRNTTRPTDTYQFPIPLGETGPLIPLFSGPLHYPFICMTEESDLGQPLVDNQNRWGMPVFKENSNRKKKNNIIGYSKDCQIKTGISYYKITKNNNITPYTADSHLSADALTEGEQLIRIEYGVIHRYIYLIAVPVAMDDIHSRTSSAHWNKKLIYQFTGGAGIGFKQGSMRATKLIERRINELKLGYAVITSGANRTSYTYNMLLSEDTARRLKQHFISLYGNPIYTVGVGGSGGGLSQYLIAQNAPGLLDGALPLYSYPDMASQTLYALDCDLLNTYYNFRTNDKAFWQDWNNRIATEGLNAANGQPHSSAIFQPINQILQGQIPSYPKGNSECINGWFGLYALIHNPKQGWLKNYVSDEIEKHVHWNYWQDLVNVYGRDEHGYARHLWGNEGVQYGLNSLKQHQITLEQFIDLNKKIGSWKHNSQFKPEQILTIPFTNIKIWLSLWGKHNIQPPDTDAKIAQRLSTDKTAVERAYRYGQIFAGVADIPIIDVRHYLENKLNMHHVSASFNARARMQKTQGQSDNQIIWIADKNYNPVSLAFEKMDKWLLNIKSGADMLTAKPADLVDQCFDSKGDIIAAGETVWDGEWNQKPNGACSNLFKIYSNSRIIAGDSWQTNTFDCTRIPITQAIKQGIYGNLEIEQVQVELEKIFPTGVCDYQQADQAKPIDLNLSSRPIWSNKAKYDKLNLSLQQ